MSKRGYHRRNMHGNGFFSSIGNAISKGNTYLKNTQLISKAAGALANAGVAPEILGKVASVAGTLGYGYRRRRVGRPRSVGGSKTRRRRVHRGGMVMGINGGRRRRVHRGGAAVISY